MTDIFISYSRKDAEFMRLLHSKLQAAERDIWVDWEDIPATADWWSEIKAAIEAADAFAFIISSNSVRSEVCRSEIQHALDNNKRFIPLLYHDMSDEDAPFVHPAIRSHNWIPFNNPEKYDESVQKLLDALSTNPDYLRRHTRLLVRAREWVQNERQNSYLLKGAELNEYQKWLSESQNLQPKPTELQLEYILASQSARARSQMRLAITGIAAVIVFALIVAFALIQNQQLRETAAQSTIVAQEQEATGQVQFATSQAQETQIAAQATNIANIRSDSQSLLTQAYIQNTQSALQTENFQLRETINAFESTPTQGISATEAAEIQASPTAQPTDDGGADLSPTEDGDTGSAPEASPTALMQATSTVDAVAQGIATATMPLPTATIPNSLPETGGGENRPDYFVNPHGDDNNDCQRPEYACQTVSAAVARAEVDSLIEVAPGVYNENLVLDKSLHIRGLQGDNTVLNGNFVGRVITVQAGAVVTIENLMITGGTAAYGGGILNAGELVLNGVVVVGNFADLAGGGVANFGDFEAERSDFSENYAPVISEIYSSGSAQGFVNGEAIVPVNSVETLGINVLVMVDTTDGDTLNMRSNPGLDAPILVRIEPSTPAVIMGGPEEHDGFRWWRISLANGQSGWVVDFVDEIQVIRPIE